jgi:serine/threonine-protein kinase SRPK3
MKKTQKISLLQFPGLRNCTYVSFALRHYVKAFNASPRKSSMQSPNLPPSIPEPLYLWQEGVEDLESYCTGGYHPTHIGDRYANDRYEIFHKLGHGGYSTVWLARDHIHDTFVAIKILIASVFNSNSESRILRLLDSRKLDHPGKAHVSSLLDKFSIH